jgi:hypothetical protein
MLGAHKNPRSKTAGYSVEKLNPQIPLYPPFPKGEPKRSPRSELRRIASLNLMVKPIGALFNHSKGNF